MLLLVMELGLGLGLGLDMKRILIPRGEVVEYAGMQSQNRQTDQAVYIKNNINLKAHVHGNPLSLPYAQGTLTP